MIRNKIEAFARKRAKALSFGQETEEIQIVSDTEEDLIFGEDTITESDGREDLLQTEIYADSLPETEYTVEEDLTASAETEYQEEMEEMLAEETELG